MGKATINKEILRIAAPAIINNVTVPLLGICDTAVAGHLGSASYLGAIAVGAMMLNVVFWLAGFLRMGTTGLTARAYGADDGEKICEVLRKSLIIAGGIGLLVLVGQILLCNLLLHIITPPEAVRPLAETYYLICVWGVPCQLVVMAVSGWFIGLQNTTIPMIISIGINLLNIAVSITLTYGIGLGFRGIAYGTLSANIAGAVWALVWAYTRYRKIPRDTTPRRYGAVKTGWREFFDVNSNLFIRSACIMAVTMGVTAMGAEMGENILAANAIIMQFFLFFSYFMDGFAFSGEALVGKYSGAGENRMVIKTVTHLMGWGGCLAAVFFCIYCLGTETIATLLTSDQDVLEEIYRYRYWIMTLPPLTVMAFIFDGIFIGLTKTGAMMWVTIAGAGVFFIMTFLGEYEMTNARLWTAFELYLVLRGGLLALDFLLIERKKLYL